MRFSFGTTAIAAAIVLTTLPPATASAEDASPEAAARARARADQIAAAAKAGDLFDNVTEGETPVLRHKASGLVCHFSPESGNEVRVYPGLPRGDDVSCGSTVEDAVVTLYAMRPGTKLSADEAFDYYVEEVTAAHPEARPFTGEVATVMAPGPLPERQTARFQLSFSGGPPVFSRLSVAVVGGWVIEERLSGPLTKAMEMDLIGELTMVQALKDLQP